MKYKVDPSKQVPPPNLPQATDAPEGSDFDVQALLDRCGAVLEREVKNIMAESSRGKLNATSARDLVAYIRLLEDLKREQLDAIKDLSDTELEALALSSKK